MTVHTNITAKELNDYTVEDIQFIMNTAEDAAKTAIQMFLDNWNKSTGGNAYGEPVYCGFAWANIYGVKGNTKLGKRMKAAGLSQDYTKAYSIWNPGAHGGQSMDVKEAGARVYAKVLGMYGFKASAGSRAD
jgi:hypothetical protein|tara:strand:+ start:588 stop:983 length:396 start_codon:yes stop_codon:yes gene_type:complete